MPQSMSRSTPGQLPRLGNVLIVTLQLLHGCHRNALALTGFIAVQHEATTLMRHTRPSRSSAGTHTLQFSAAWSRVSAYPYDPPCNHVVFPYNLVWFKHSCTPGIVRISSSVFNSWKTSVGCVFPKDDAFWTDQGSADCRVGQVQLLLASRMHLGPCTVIKQHVFSFTLSLASA